MTDRKDYHFFKIMNKLKKFYKDYYLFFGISMFIIGVIYGTLNFNKDRVRLQELKKENLKLEIQILKIKLSKD